jgi:integrase
VFVSERGAPLSAPGFSRMVERAVAAADLGIKAHAHRLRHACGYKLAKDGHDTRASRLTLDIGIFRTRRAIRRWRRSGLKSSFEIDRGASAGIASGRARKPAE